MLALGHLRRSTDRQADHVVHLGDARSPRPEHTRLGHEGLRVVVVAGIFGEHASDVADAALGPVEALGLAGVVSVQVQATPEHTRLRRGLQRRGGVVAAAALTGVDETHEHSATGRCAFDGRGFGDLGHLAPTGAGLVTHDGRQPGFVCLRAHADIGYAPRVHAS